MPSDAGERPNDFYAWLGIRPLINYRGIPIVLGGSLMHPVIVDARTKVADRFVNFSEVAIAASCRIAELTGAESVLVISGAVAAMPRAIQTAIASGDLAAAGIRATHKLALCRDCMWGADPLQSMPSAAWGRRSG